MLKENWYYTDLQGIQSGPVPFETIDIMVEDGLLHSESLLWHDSLVDWKTLNEVDGLFDGKNIRKLHCSGKTLRKYAEKRESVHPMPVLLDKPQEQSDLIISQIASSENTYGILWTILGILQILSFFGFIAGVWNIYASRVNFTRSKQIIERHPGIPKAFENQTGLMIALFINLFFGGIIGVLLIIYGFHIRSLVLKNAHLFSGRPEIQTLAA